MLSQIAFVRVCAGIGLACCTMMGCGGGDFDVVPITGKVTCKGKALAQGSLVRFIPDPGDGTETTVGKPATGQIQADGTFTLSTYETGDGAVVGRHRIMVLPPSNETLDEEAESETGEPRVDSEQENSQAALPCPAPKDLFVEITPDTEVVNIELDGGGTVATE